MAASGSTDRENKATNTFHMDFSLEDGLCSDLPINCPSSKSHHNDNAHQNQQLNDTSLACNETLEDDDDSLDEDPEYPPSKYLKVDLVEKRLEQDKVVQGKEISEGGKETEQEEEEEINVKVELETDEEEDIEAEVETDVHHKKLFEPGPSLHRSRKQNISVVRIHGYSTASTCKPREVQKMQNPRLSSAKPQPHVSSTPTIIHQTNITTRPSILRRKTPATSTKSRGHNNENLPTPVGIKYKTMYRSEGGKTFGYVVPVPFSQPPSSSSVTVSTLNKAPKQTTSARIDTNLNSKVVQSGDHRKPLQPQLQPNYKDDRSRYRDFIHCCKCFTTFYNFRDLVRHFDRCTLPYPNQTRSFKDYKLQQSKENQSEKAKETPVAEVEAIVLEEGEITTPLSKKVPVSTPSSSSTAFTNPQPKYSSYITKTLRKYKVARYNFPKRSRPDPNKPARLAVEPASVDLDSSTLTSPGASMQQDDGGNTEANHLCSECGEVFKTSFSLDLHMNRHRGHVGPYKCTVEGCTRQYSDQKFLTRHERLVHPTENQLSCSEIFFNARDLRDHQNAGRLDPQTPFKCHHEDCSEVFNSRRERKNHYRREHYLKTYKCPVENCGKSFRYNDALKKHGETHRDRSERKTVVCDFPDCGVTFVNSYSVNHHKKTVHEQRSRDFLCPTCGKAFYDNGALQTHLITHSTETPHLCSFCGKGFKQLHALNYHMQIHSQESPHKCPHCEKRFKQKQGVRAHLKSHEGGKMVKCRHCDKTFRDKGKRDSHEQVHTGFRPFECKFCGDTFKDITVVKRHVKRQHPDCEFDLRDPDTYRVKRKPVDDPILEQEPASSS